MITYLLLLALLLFLSSVFLLSNKTTRERKKFLEVVRNMNAREEALKMELAKFKNSAQSQTFELDEAREKISDFNKEKSDFVTLMTHEMRTPISALSWIMDMLENSDSKETTEELINKGKQSIDRMNALVDRILNIEKAEASGQPSFNAISVGEVLSLVLQEFSSLAARKNISLSYEPPRETLKIDSNKDELAMVVRELVNNAITYTKPGGRVELKINAEKLNAARPSIQIVVSDTGIGIPESERDKVFQKFYRSKEATAMETEGLGLGLNLIMQVVKRHNGSIWFTDNPGGGTIFYVELPVNQSHQ